MIVLDLHGLYLLGLFFTVVFGGATVLLWKWNGSWLSGVIVNVLAIFFGFWLAGKSGIGAAGLSGLIFLVVLGVAAIILELVPGVRALRPRWVMIGLAIVSVTMSVGLYWLDYQCASGLRTPSELSLRC